MRVNIEYDRLVNDTLLSTSYFICENVNVLPDFLEIKELFARDFFEDGPRLGFVMQMVQSKL